MHEKPIHEKMQVSKLLNLFWCSLIWAREHADSKMRNFLANKKKTDKKFSRRENSWPENGFFSQKKLAEIENSLGKKNTYKYKYT